MRKYVFFVILIVLIAAMGCTNQLKMYSESVYVIKGESFLVDFYEHDGIVHILCRITIENRTTMAKTVSVVGYSPEDVNTGLLKEAKLIGYNEDGNTGEFVVEAENKSTIIVDFQGQYAGNLVKYDRLLPDIIELVVK